MNIISFTAVVLFAAAHPTLQPSTNDKGDTTQMHVVNHSFARPDQVIVKHLELDLVVDFTKKQLRGKATLHIQNRVNADRLYLDSRGLAIQKVTLGTRETDTRFMLGEPVAHFGEALVVEILPDTRIVNVYYSTNPDAAALQWLAPEQTFGKKAPFLFTQSQAILARTWVPCQDNPSVRMTYNARIKVPPGMMALMSAQNSPNKKIGGVYEFVMQQPIPSYLLALAVGDLEFRKISDRCGVYAEPSIVEQAAWEFADTERMIRAAEDLYGPYRWERYDILVLPPSFPFGGMENPRLTFATPTILAGDRSLVSLVAHELAHSWSGNLVTNATWNDFWINEGFTTYIERRILEEVYGKEFADMITVLGMQDLENTVDELGAGNPDTRLQIDLEGRDPDDAVSDIPYEKGSLFLRSIEETVGRQRWDAFLHLYFKEMAFQTMTTKAFLSFLERHLFNGDTSFASKLNVNAWIHNPGMPPSLPSLRSAAFETVEEQVARWSNGTTAKDLEVEGWVSQQWTHFLRHLPSPLSPTQLKELDEAFDFTRGANAHVKQDWFLLVIAVGYKEVYPSLEKYLVEVGRRWLIKPLYVTLAETPEGKTLARQIYEKARPGYHAVTARTIDEVLNWTK